ncbi:hypothetical protein CCHR01_15765 [Colletotrichum chrysophilum]|uniref:Uncharacterized protein n=1 Tax=Colletotrichum chrysophilum TaxID=1836956 RepID=A0AAD9A528_9PEZI|nr:hypothetical protein CCHR01_15765 [Colletotrichum chrysophilum]
MLRVCMYACVSLSVSRSHLIRISCFNIPSPCFPLLSSSLLAVTHYYSLHLPSSIPPPSRFCSSRFPFLDPPPSLLSYCSSQYLVRPFCPAVPPSRLQLQGRLAEKLESAFCLARRDRTSAPLPPSYATLNQPRPGETAREAWKTKKEGRSRKTGPRRGQSWKPRGKVETNETNTAATFISSQKRRLRRRETKMPSLSLLRRGTTKRHEQQQQPFTPQTSPRREDERVQRTGTGFGSVVGGAGAGAGTLAGSGTGERERKSSKRDFFGGLLGRSRSRTPTTSTSSPASSARGTGAESPTKLPVSRHSRVYSCHPFLWCLFRSFPLPSFDIQRSSTHTRGSIFHLFSGPLWFWLFGAPQARSLKGAFSLGRAGECPSPVSRCSDAPIAPARGREGEGSGSGK